MKFYLPGGNCVLIVTAVWAFSGCEQNNWIIPEVILLFRRLTRTVRPVSGERVCLEGLWDQGSCLFGNGLRHPSWAKSLRVMHLDRQRMSLPPLCWSVCVCYMRICLRGMWHSLTLTCPGVHAAIAAKAAIQMKVRAQFNCFNLIQLMRHILSYFDPTLPLLPVSRFHFVCFRALLCENQCESHGVLPTG